MNRCPEHGKKKIGLEESGPCPVNVVYVNVEIEEDDEGTTKWYIGVIKEVKEGTCTITFDGLDSSHNIQVAVDEIPSDDIIFL